MIDLLHVLHAIALAGLFAAFCLGTGAVVTRWLSLPGAMIPAIGFGCSSLAGMIAFCIWWFSPDLGGILSLAGGIGGVALFTAQLSEAGARARIRAAAPAFAMTLLLLASWLCLLHAGGVAAAQRFTWDLPVDDQLPLMFADRIAAGSFTGPITGDWLASDRPPLQAGVLLLFRPFMGHERIAHETIATLCQLGWMPALAALGLALRLRKRSIALGLFLASTSGFFLVNSVYTWPKLMAAALFVTAIAAIIEFTRTRGREIAREALAAGALLALASLAHGGIWFSLLALPFFPASWVALKRFGFRGAVVLAITFAAVNAPWIAYQRIVDPPGNRLEKWHLAGAVEPDERSLLRALGDAYTKTPISDLARMRWENAKLVLIPPRQTGSERWDEYLRRLQFFYVVPAVGLPLAGVVWLFVRPSRRRDAPAGVAALAVYSAAMLAIWTALIFIPGGTIVHAGSYVPEVLLIFLGSAAIATWRPAIIVPVIVAHCALFLAAWILTTPVAPGSANNATLLAAAAVLSAGFWAILWKAPDGTALPANA